MIMLIDLFPNGAFHGQCKQIESKHCNYKKRVSKSHPAVNSILRKKNIKKFCVAITANVSINNDNNDNVN